MSCRSSRPYSDAPVGHAAAALGLETVTRPFLLGFVAVAGVATVLVMMVLYQFDA